MSIRQQYAGEQFVAHWSKVRHAEHKLLVNHSNTFDIVVNLG